MPSTLGMDTCSSSLRGAGRKGGLLTGFPKLREALRLRCVLVIGFVVIPLAAGSCGPSRANDERCCAAMLRPCCWPAARRSDRVRSSNGSSDWSLQCRTRLASPCPRSLQATRAVVASCWFTARRGRQAAGRICWRLRRAISAGSRSTGPVSETAHPPTRLRRRSRRSSRAARRLSRNARTGRRSSVEPAARGGRLRRSNQHCEPGHVSGRVRLTRRP